MTLDEMIDLLKQSGEFDDVELEDTGILLGRFRCVKKETDTVVEVEVFDHGETAQPRFWCKAFPIGSTHALAANPAPSVNGDIMNVHWNNLPS